MIRLAPLALLVAAPAAAQAPTQTHDWSRAERIDVALSNFKFSPDTIRLKAGHAYRLHLSSSGGHSFAAKAFFAAAKLAPQDRARVTGGKVELDGGESADIRFVAPAAGSYPIRCTHFLHASFGMTGRFVVQ